MTDLPQSDAWGLGQPAGPLALRRLIAVDPGEFASEYWGRQALLSPASSLPYGFGDLLDESAIDELVAERGLRTPFLRVAKNGSTLPNRSFTAPGGVGATIDDQLSDDKLVRLFADGSTMVLQALHRVWPPILTFCQQLAADLGHPVQANAYVTPPQNQGFDHHYDVHDVFVLQVAGEKEWTIHAPVLASPLRDQPWTDRRAVVARQAEGPPLIKTVLRPGDCLYLPRGFLHAARACGGVSTHLTVGVHAWTRHALAESLVHEALRTAAADQPLRASLAVGVAFDEPATWADDLEEARARLIRALERVDAAALQAGLLGSARTSQRAAPVGPLAQLRGAAELGPRDQVRLREHLMATLDEGPSGPVLRSRAGELRLGATDLESVRELLDGQPRTAAAVGLDLARRLLTNGILVRD